MACHTLARWAGRVLLPALVLVAAAIAGAPARAADTLNIWLVGDSITVGVNYTQDAGYRGTLFRDLTAAGLDFRFVGTAAFTATPELLAAGQEHHEGRGGWRIYQVDLALDGEERPGVGYWLASPSGPPAVPDTDVIVLNIGTNDTNQRDDKPPPSEAPARLDRLVDRMTAYRPDARLILSTIVPPRDDTRLALTCLYNQSVRDTVAKYQALGRHISCCDVFPSFMDGERVMMISGDNVHPNAAGYQTLGHAYAQAIMAVLPEPAGLATLLGGMLLLVLRRRPDPRVLASGRGCGLSP